MSKHKLVLVGTIAMAGLFPATAGATPPQQHIPVTICHNGNTITVDDDAVPAHVAHGDTPGACVVTPPVEPPVEPPVVPPVEPPVAPPTPTPEAPPVDVPTPTPDNPVPPTELVEDQPKDKPGKLTADRPVKKKGRVEIGTPASFSSPDPSAGVPLELTGEGGTLPVTGVDAWLIALFGAGGLVCGFALRRATRGTVRELTVGSLFAGIGGFDLGLERAGMRTVWFCEQDEFCQRVLAKHWPGVPCYPDVRALRGVERPDVLAGGFPCQDLSYAGQGAGIDGERSGLWFEYARLVRELRPRYVIVENVPALLSRGLGRVLGDLAACGYDAEWDCVSAAAIGAPHRRDRVWLVAYPNSGGEVGSDPDRGGREVVGVAESVGVEGQRGGIADRLCKVREFNDGAGGEANWWLAEPDVGRVANGVPHRVDRLRALGNALVPQIAEWLGRRILEWEGENR